MTGPVIAFDAGATRGAKLARIEPTQVPADEAITSQPSSPPSGPDAVTRQRAEVTASYAALLGQPLKSSDILETLTTGQLTPDAIVAALTTAGLRAEATVVLPPKPQHWPAIARLTSDKLVVVLEQTRDTVVIHDPSAPDNREEVALREFTEHFTGRIIRATVPAAVLTDRHGTKAAKGHWFWSEILSFRRIIGEVALGSLVANLLAVAVALFSLQVYDRVIPNQSTATLWVLTIGAGLALLMEASLRIARARLMDNAGRRIELRLQEMLMGKLLGMKSKPDAAPSQTFAAMREFSSIREFFTASTIGSLTDIPFVFLFLALVWSIGGPVVWVLVAGGVLMVLPSIFLQKRMMALTLATQGASTKSSRLLQEAVFEADTIKSQRGEGRFARQWAELTTLSAFSNSEQRSLSSTLTSWAQGVQQATYVSAVVVGTFLVFAGEFTVGTIIAVGILTSRTLGPLTGLASLIARWSNTKAALEALDRIVEAEQDEDTTRTYLRRETLRGQFELRDLTFTYDADSARALDIAGLEIPAGQTVAVLGANGSGKSTLLKVMAGLTPPTAGRVMIDGADMGQVAARDLRRNIGYLGQEVRLFAGTLRDNLNLTQLERDDDRMLDALDFGGLGQFVRAHPKGLDLDIRDGGQGLSVGQRQSIGWARLWLQNPAVCILDEPTSALDQTLENTLVSRLNDWLAGRTVILATHRMAVLQLADRTMVLHNGRLAVDGPRDQVLAHLSKEAS